MEEEVVSEEEERHSLGMPIMCVQGCILQF